ncbi:MAG: 50S ribosomal protein L10 [Thaumarchaeota archaeon]|nr:50S ribosomal protein L10 [Nitrososphaerota archaeon]
MTTYQRKKDYPTKKKELMEKIKKNLESHKNVAVVNLYKLRSIQIGELRKKLKGQVVFLGVKNKIAEKALKSTKYEKLSEFIKGQSLLMFFDMDPFELNIVLEKNQVYLPAKAGDIATDDIIVPAGNTGLQAGPVLSEFKELKIPTRIETGSVFVTKDTIVAKKGEVINEKLASLLSKLGIKPIRSGLSIKAAYFDGLVIKGEDLKIDVEAYKNNVIESYQKAFKLAYALELPYPEILSLVIADRYNKAKRVAVKAGVYTDETIKDIIVDRESKASVIRSLIK